MSNGSTSSSDRAGRVLTLLLGLYLTGTGLLSIVGLITIFPEVKVEALSLNQPDPAGVVTGAGSRGSDRPRAGNSVASQRDPLITLVFPKMRCPMLFPTPKVPSTDQGLLILAFLAGAIGSFLHSGQSFIAFVGNNDLRKPWAWWYVLRPPLGGVLGVFFYCVIRGGLLSGQNAVSPHGVVAFAGFAGWFSKQATEKLAQTFEALFPTPKELKDGLTSRTAKPVIDTVEMRPDTNGDLLLEIHGAHFGVHPQLSLEHVTLAVLSATETRIDARISAATKPAAGTTGVLTVTNDGRESGPFVVSF